MPKKRKWFGLVDLFPYIKKYLPLIITMCLLGVLSSIADSAYPLFNRYALNHYIGKKTLDTIGYFVFLYILILVLQVIDNFISSYICSKVELDIGRDLKNASFNHLQTLSFSYFNNNNVLHKAKNAVKEAIQIRFIKIDFSNSLFSFIE